MQICPPSRHNLAAATKPIFISLIKIKNNPPALEITKTPTNSLNSIHF
jgi:hypothetical protein